ncbi:MAG: thermostable hemolysin [Gallionella sp.]
MMTKSSSSPNAEMAERPFTVRFSKYDSADRDELESFISNIFRKSYGAKISRFKPYLMSLRDPDDKLIAGCGLHSAAIDRLSLESFLDKPVEEVLSEHTGSPVKRSEIVEIGNFSVAELTMARHLISAINDQLHFTSKQWAVLTAVPALIDAFIKSGMDPEILVDADMNRLSDESRMEWGSYFEQKPQIIAVRRMERRNKPRIGGNGISAP